MNPEPRVPSKPVDLGPPRRVFAKRFVAMVRAEPDPEARSLGYLRAGALLRSTTTLPLGTAGCPDGWYELESGGFVCSGRDVTIFDGERLPELRGRQPDREAPMPYEYATVRRRTPLYRRIPAVDEMVELPEPETEAVGSLDPEGDQQAAVAELPPFEHPLVERVLQPGFYVSLDRTFERDGRVFWRTQQNGFVEEAALRMKPWSEFHGRALDDANWSLPVAVTRRGATPVYRINARGRLKTTREALEPRTWLPVRGRRQIDAQTYLVVGDGRLVREENVRIIGAREAPPDVAEGEPWIDLDLTQQSLVAYDGQNPRYVTLISSGRRRSPSPEIDYLTPRGTFRVRAKHLTATMDSDEPGEPPYSLEDVPYVMYFRGAYAFHSAFWHDHFGRPRSHGCINMAPVDAKWLFEWADPQLPVSWHGGYATDQNPGVWVFVHGETP